MRLVREPRDGPGIVGANVSAPAARSELADDRRESTISPAEGAHAFIRVLSPRTDLQGSLYFRMGRKK